MIFINDANTKIQELLNKDNVLAIYLNMVEQYNKKHKTVYAQQMQVYITKIVIILSDCAKKEKIKQNTQNTQKVDSLKIYKLERIEVRKHK